MSLQFAEPWLLTLLLIVPLIVARWLLARTALEAPNRRGSDAPFEMRPQAASLTHSYARWARDLPHSWRVTWRPMLAAMRLLAVSLILVALARPQIVQGKEIVRGEGIDIALALDISGSMASLDFQPQNRLQAAKQVIGDFITGRSYDKIGMVVFASEAFSQTPLTLDQNALRRSLDQIELATDLGLEDGTAIGLGIANAASMLAGESGEAAPGADSRVIILLTDGVSNAGQVDPMTAAEAAKALGIKIYTIGAGRPGQVPVPVQGLFGTEIVYQESQLDEETLRQVAEITGGKFFRAENTESLQAIYDEINELEKSQVEIEVHNQYQELAGWLMMPALLILLSELVLNQTVFRRIP